MSHHIYIQSNPINITNKVNLVDGDEIDPSVGFLNLPSTGIYLTDDNCIGVTVNGETTVKYAQQYTQYKKPILLPDIDSIQLLNTFENTYLYTKTYEIIQNDELNGINEIKKLLNENEIKPDENNEIKPDENNENENNENENNEIKPDENNENENNENNEIKPDENNEIKPDENNEIKPDEIFYNAIPSLCIRKGDFEMDIVSEIISLKNELDIIQTTKNIESIINTKKYSSDDNHKSLDFKDNYKSLDFKDNISFINSLIVDQQSNIDNKIDTGLKNINNILIDYKYEIDEKFDASFMQVNKDINDYKLFIDEKLDDELSRIDKNITDSRAYIDEVSLDNKILFNNKLKSFEKKLFDVDSFINNFDAKNNKYDSITTIYSFTTESRTNSHICSNMNAQNIISSLIKSDMLETDFLKTNDIQSKSMNIENIDVDHLIYGALNGKNINANNITTKDFTCENITSDMFNSKTIYNNDLYSNKLVVDEIISTTNKCTNITSDRIEGKMIINESMFSDTAIINNIELKKILGNDLYVYNRVYFDRDVKIGDYNISHNNSNLVIEHQKISIIIDDTNLHSGLPTIDEIPVSNNFVISDEYVDVGIRTINLNNCSIESKDDNLYCNINNKTHNLTEKKYDGVLEFMANSYINEGDIVSINNNGTISKTNAGTIKLTDINLFDNYSKIYTFEYENNLFILSYIYEFNNEIYAVFQLINNNEYTIKKSYTIKLIDSNIFNTENQSIDSDSDNDNSECNLFSKILKISETKFFITLSHKNSNKIVYIIINNVLELTIQGDPVIIDTKNNIYSIDTQFDDITGTIMIAYYSTTNNNINVILLGFIENNIKMGIMQNELLDRQILINKNIKYIINDVNIKLYKSLILTLIPGGLGIISYGNVKKVFMFNSFDSNISIDGNIFTDYDIIESVNIIYNCDNNTIITFDRTISGTLYVQILGIFELNIYKKYSKEVSSENILPLGIMYMSNIQGYIVTYINTINTEFYAQRLEFTDDRFIFGMRVNLYDGCNDMSKLSKTKKNNLANDIQKYCCHSVNNTLLFLYNKSIFIYNKYTEGNSSSIIGISLNSVNPNDNCKVLLKGHIFDCSKLTHKVSDKTVDRVSDKTVDRNKLKLLSNNFPHNFIGKKIYLTNPNAKFPCNFSVNQNNGIFVGTCISINHLLLMI